MGRWVRGWLCVGLSLGELYRYMEGGREGEGERERESE